MSISKSYKFSGERKSPLSEAASLMGKKGGPAAAKVRFSKMTEAARSEHGRNLVAARERNRAARDKQEMMDKKIQ